MPTPHVHPRALLLLLLALSTLLVTTSPARALPDDDRHVIPLLPSYALLHDDPRYTRPDDPLGRYQLVETTPTFDGGVSILLPAVEELAVIGPAIVGRSAGGHFLLDTARRDPTPQVFTSRDAWLAALSAASIPAPTALATPDTLAAPLPDTTLRPWRYRVMGAALGLTDDLWSITLQLAGLALALLLGLLFPAGRSPTSVAVILGLATNVVAQIMIAGGGPGAFVGFLFFPALYATAATLTHRTRTALLRLKTRHLDSVPPARQSPTTARGVASLLST